MIEVACAIITNEKGEILAVQRSERMKLPLKWEFAGGKLEQGETAKECLVREINEELGVVISIENNFGSYPYSYPEQDIILYAFLCKILSGEILLKEHADLRWLMPNQLLDLDWAEADLPIVKGYLIKLDT